MQQVRNAAPDVDKLESDLIVSNEKVKTLCETVQRLELKLKDVSTKLGNSIANCDQLSIENRKLCSTQEDLSNQVYYLK